MTSQTDNQNQSQAQSPRLPGIFKLTWMLFMQPITLHYHLKACGIDEPDAPICMLWRDEENRTIKRRYAINMMTILLGAIPVLFFILSLTLIGLFILLGYPIDYLAWAKKLAFGVAQGVAFGVALDVALGVAECVAFGVAKGMALGVAFGMTVGVVFGVAFSVPVGVAVSVAKGVAVGVAVGMAVGVVFGAAFIITYLRLPLYLPEALVQIFLYMKQNLFSNSTLSSVPVLYHELSYLPHPFLGSHILLNAENDPALVKRVLKACDIAPGQRRAGQFALAHLQARELEKQIQQQQFGEILELKGQWLPGVEGAKSSLLALREIARYLNIAEKSEIVHQRLQHLTQAEISLNSVKNQLLSDKSYLSHALRGTLPAWENVIADLRRQAEKLAI